MTLEFINDINRTSNITTYIILLILLYFNNISYNYIFKLFINDLIINKTLTNLIFKPLIGNKTIPILGTGIRPPGAMNCGSFRDNLFNSTIIPSISKSYGFPSGHAQTMGYFMTFIYSHFRNNPLIFLPFLLYSIYISYTRVQLGCHTVQQVIAGYIFGILSYYLIDYIYDKIVYLLNTIYYKIKYFFNDEAFQNNKNN
jgi:membrane-associated phospholipid phosphatase